MHEKERASLTAYWKTERYVTYELASIIYQSTLYSIFLLHSCCMCYWFHERWNLEFNIDFEWWFQKLLFFFWQFYILSELDKYLTTTATVTLVAYVGKTFSPFDLHTDIIYDEETIKIKKKKIRLIFPYFSTSQILIDLHPVVMKPCISSHLVNPILPLSLELKWAPAEHFVFKYLIKC